MKEFPLGHEESTAAVIEWQWLFVAFDNFTLPR